MNPETTPAASVRQCMDNKFKTEVRWIDSMMRTFQLPVPGQMLYATLKQDYLDFLQALEKNRINVPDKDRACWIRK